MTYNYCAFSFGGGVQSTTILLKLIHEFEQIKEVMGHTPDCLYFADTGAEPDGVYAHIETMQRLLFDAKKVNPQLPDFKVVSNGSILNTETTRSGFTPILSAPYFISNSKTNKVTMLRRQCTQEFKIKPISQQVRKDNNIGYRKRGKKNSIAQWIGISTDEAIRAKDNRMWAFQSIYPLLKLGMSRDDCIAYNTTFGINVEKSGCFFCPYKSS